MSNKNITYIDGTDLVLGRLSSWLAKGLLEGEEFVVVNAQNLIISGKRKSIIDDFLQKRSLATHTNPRRGPFYPRFPDRILRRTVRGMLPWKKSSGKEAFRRLAAYIDIPEELQDKNFITVPQAKRKLSGNYVTVGEVSRSIGWQHGVNN